VPSLVKCWWNWPNPRSHVSCFVAVNFINVLRASFSYESAFIAKRNLKKRCEKTIVQKICAKNVDEIDGWMATKKELRMREVMYLLLLLQSYFLSLQEKKRNQFCSKNMNWKKIKRRYYKLKLSLWLVILYFLIIVKQHMEYFRWRKC